MSRMTSTLLGMGWSLLFDVVIIVSMLFGFNEISEKFFARLDTFSKEGHAIRERQDKKYSELVEKSNQTHAEMMKQAKEGTIWLLRDDIIKTIDYHEAIKTITQKQFKRLKDEYEYYISIGGNHDVRDRFDDFYTKIFATAEVKMVAAEPIKLTK